MVWSTYMYWIAIILRNTKLPYSYWYYIIVYAFYFIYMFLKYHYMVFIIQICWLISNRNYVKALLMCFLCLLHLQYFVAFIESSFILPLMTWMEIHNVRPLGKCQDRLILQYSKAASDYYYPHSKRLAHVILWCTTIPPYRY